MALAGFAGMVSLFLLTALQGKISALRVTKYRPLLLLGFLFFMNYIVWVTALAHLPLANFYTVIFLAPTVGSIAAALFLKEKLTWPRMLAIAAGFVGVVIAVNPVQMMHDQSDWISYGVAFVGMLVIICQMMVMRFVGDSISREALAFYPRIAAVLGGLGAAVIFGFAPMSLKGFIYCLFTGFIGGMGWMFIAHAYKLAPAATVAPFHYSQVITGGLIGYLVWHDVPSLNLLAGAAIIIVSGLYIANHARRAGQLAKTLMDVP
jgi:drug/metabolite transporter (DMT)-like permease